MGTWNPTYETALVRITADGGTKPEEMPKQYQIIENKAAKGLTAEVNQYLAQGWRLVGGPYYDGKNHCQAVQR